MKYYFTNSSSCGSVTIINATHLFSCFATQKASALQKQKNYTLMFIALVLDTESLMHTA